MGLNISCASEEWKQGYQDAFHWRPHTPTKTRAKSYTKGYQAGRAWHEDRLRFIRDSIKLFRQHKDAVAPGLLEHYEQEGKRLRALLRKQTKENQC